MAGVGKLNPFSPLNKAKARAGWFRNRRKARHLVKAAKRDLARRTEAARHAHDRVKARETEKKALRRAEKAHARALKLAAAAPARQKLPAKLANKPAPMSALGYLVLAGLILAWPREAGGARPSLRSLLGGRLKPGPAEEVDHAAATEPGRGRGARTPTDIPKRGWKDILIRTWSEFNEDRITAVAGGVAFFSLLALFPALAAFVSLYGLFADVTTVQKQLNFLAGVLPGGALTVVGDELTRLTSSKHGGLSFALVLSVLLSLWSANSGVKALFDGLNVAYEQKERRGFVKLTLVSLAFTLGSIAFVLLALGAVVAAPAVLSFLHLPSNISGLALLRWPVLLVVTAGVLSLLYRFGPSREHARWRWVTPGSLAAAVLWLVVSLLFSWYVGHFGSYNKTYGALGAVAGFMTWMWLSVIVVLFGAELNAEIEHQTAVDTTTGQPQMIGARGAKMADEIGAAKAH